MARSPDKPPADDTAPVNDESSAGGRASRRMVLYLLTLVATVAVTAVLVGRVGGFFEAIRDARPGWVLASLAMACAGVLLGTLRWQIVVEAMPYRLAFSRALVVVLATWPLALVTPSRANDLLRAVAVRGAVPLPAGTGSVLAEKVVDLALLLALGVLGAALEGLWLWGAFVALALAIEIAAVALLMTHRSKLARLPFVRSRAQKIDDLFLAFEALLASPWRLASVCAASLVIRGFTIGITFALLRAVDADVDLFDTFALWPVAMLVGLIPVTLAGMGTRDATFMFLLSKRGHIVTHAGVLAATMGYTAIAVGFFAVVGLPFMVRESLVRPE
jgi:uncharacterized protein (TIRG00374 family)